jgi:type IV pilus assembly protein PilC
MATDKSKDAKEAVFEWEGKDRNGKLVRGETRAIGENQVRAALRRQGVVATRVKKRRMGSGKAIRPKDLAIFTRQLATMMKAGVPLLQAFDIVGRGNPNPSVTRLLNGIRTDVETGTSLNVAFRKYPLYFDNLYCNLVEAGEAAGILDQLLDRLAVYMEKTEAMKSKIKSALMYPISVLIVAFVVTAVIMIFVVPAFKEVFANFGADLPGPTLFVIAMSEIFVQYWWLIFGGLFGGVYFFMQAWRCACLFLAPWWTNPVSPAGPAHSPPCLLPAYRWWRHSIQWGVRPETRSTRQRPSKSSKKCRPARP